MMAETAPATPDEIHQCADCVGLMGDYVDGLLSAAKSAALERHLSLCMPCITFVRTYKATSRAARENLNRELPDELVSSLHQFLRKSIPGFSCASKIAGGCGAPLKALAKKGA
jgi:anti-sigma factor RsiW